MRQCTDVHKSTPTKSGLRPVIPYRSAEAIKNSRSTQRVPDRNQLQHVLIENYCSRGTRDLIEAHVKKVQVVAFRLLDEAASV
jgi:hypothetical protein